MSSTITIKHELSVDDLLQIIKDAKLSSPEKRKVLEILFPNRTGCSDNQRLVGDITEFLYTGL